MHSNIPLIQVRNHACLAINPRQRSRGALLVMPFAHTHHLTDCNPQELSDISDLTLTGIHLLRETLEPDGIHTFCNSGMAAGQSEDHMHVQIIPRYAQDPYSFAPSDEIPISSDDELMSLAISLQRGNKKIK
ncbi:HIT family protein [Microbulbifer sp. CnH-101-G]|uniref:HIT family protein n=1 Tax=Microbulbifer sp. CnH-101-G TaxID=3243393 RepID=UPI004039F3A7